MNTDQPPRGKKLAVIGAWLQLGALIGGAGTVVGMIHAFDVLGRAGTGDPSALSVAIGEVLIYTFIGFAVNLVGWVISCFALVVSRYRAPWFFWFHLIYALILLTGFPVGTIIGLVILCYILPHKAEFFPSPPSAPTGE